MKDKFNSLLTDEIKSAILDSSCCAEKFGCKIFLIGGIVRDLILDNPVKDIDIAVQADAIEFANFMAKTLDCEVVGVQENLRTAKVKFSSGVEIDFASTREEKYSESGTLPIAFNFGCDLKEDVKRRDFTINTLAIELTGEDKFSLVDYCCGHEDILNKRIRMLHAQSFIDDPSRIVRALKFKTRFDFEFEETTYDLMQQYLSDVNEKMPLERVKSEFRQLFSIKKCVYDEVIRTNIYKLISDCPIESIDYSALEQILKFEMYDESEIWFLFVCCLIINSNFAQERLNMTAFEKKVLSEAKELMQAGKIKLNDNEKIYKLYNEKIDLSIALFYLITKEQSVIKYLTALKQIKVLITGNDLIEIGFIPSKYFSELFDMVLKEKLKGRLKNKKEELDFVKKFLKKQDR